LTLLVAGFNAMRPSFDLCTVAFFQYSLSMTATAVIEEIKHLPPGEQSRVIQFAVELARTRQLAGNELSALAQRMVESDDPAEVEKLKSALTHGFYGG
jgi:hypothetical protein